MMNSNNEPDIKIYVFGVIRLTLHSNEGLKFIAESNDKHVFNSIKSGFRGLSPTLQISEFSCSICQQNYEECPHESNKNYEGKICEAQINIWKPLRVLLGKPKDEISNVTDVLLIINNDDKTKQYVWYSYTKNKKRIIENIIKTQIKNWLDEKSANHLKAIFEYSPIGIGTYPLNPEFILSDGYRVDLLGSNTESVDKKNNNSIYIKAELEFNKNRYDTISIDNELYLFDKFDQILIPYNKTKELLTNRMKGQELYFIRPKISNINKYIEERKKIIDKNISEFQENITSKYVILNIDIIGSTKMSQELSLNKNAKMMEIFAEEMTLVIDQFHGVILKHTGDGLFAYFPIPTFGGMEDNVLDCAISMKLLIEEGINKILFLKEFPELQFRIGIETGYVVNVIVGHKNIMQQNDVLGETINLTAKIQKLAEKNQIVIGEAMFKNLSTEKRMAFHEFKPDDWNYINNSSGGIYKVYQIKNVSNK